MIKYVFDRDLTDDAPLPVLGAKGMVAQRVGTALQDIANKSGGRLTPKAVVEAAKSKTHILHSHFEWSDAKAADAYRIDQARNLIRLVRIEDDISVEPVRAFLSANDGTGVCYHSFQNVRESESLQSAIMKAAKRDLEAFNRRYRSLKDVCSDVVEAIRKIDARIEDRP